MHASRAIARISTALLLILSTDAAVAANDPLRQYEAAKQFHDEWVQRAADTQRQLDTARAKA